jgi:hypothetical protein
LQWKTVVTPNSKRISTTGHQTSRFLYSRNNHIIGIGVRTQEGIYKNDVFQAHIINAISINDSKRFKRTADRHYLRNDEKKRRQE